MGRATFASRPGELKDGDGGVPSPVHGDLTRRAEESKIKNGTQNPNQEQIKMLVWGPGERDRPRTPCNILGARTALL